MTDLPALLEALDLIRRAATQGRRAYLKGVAGERPTVALVNDQGLTHLWLCTVSTEPDAAYIAALPPEVVGALTDCVRALQRIQQVDAPPDYGVTRKAWDAGAEALAALAIRLEGG